MSKNPWKVSSVEDFLYYSCPECEFKASKKSEFYKHALSVHPRAVDSIDSSESNQNNPWNVKTFEDFRVFLCPECNVTSVTKTLFIKHALKSHENSEEFIEKFLFGENSQNVTEEKKCDKSDESSEENDS